MSGKERVHDIQTLIYIIFLATLICLLSNTICLARIAPEQVALGGITIDASMDYVKRIYGEPTTEEDRYWGFPKKKKYIVHKYGSTFIVTYFDDGYVMSLQSTGENGLATPDGVMVGMEADVLEKIYGKSDDVTKSKNSKYYAMEGQPYFIGIRFDIKENKISRIEVAAFVDD